MRTTANSIRRGPDCAPCASRVSRAGVTCIALCSLLLSALGCNNPGMNLAVQPFVSYPVSADGAYKVRLGISDTRDELFGMMDVAIGLDLEFASFVDIDGEMWTYMRAGIPLVASARAQGGFFDHSYVRGWPSIPEEKQTRFLRGVVAGPAWLFGMSLKYLHSGQENMLALGPNLAFESVRQIGNSSMGMGYSFEIDLGLDLRDGDPYASVSMGLLIVCGGPTKW